MGIVLEHKKTPRADEIEARYNDNAVFNASRYPKSVHVYWRVDPAHTKECYVAQLADFYKALKEGSYEKIHGMPFRPVHMTHEYCNEGLRLDTIEGDNPSITILPYFIGFKEIKIDTPYATFGMLDHNGIWTPETGMLSVTVMQNLSEPVSELMTNTSKNKAPRELLQQTLSELFRFS